MDIGLSMSTEFNQDMGTETTLTGNHIRIEGSTPQGVFYGLQTFRQLITTHHNTGNRHDAAQQYRGTEEDEKADTSDV